LRAAIREQVGSTVKRLHREGAISNIGAGTREQVKDEGILTSDVREPSFHNCRGIHPGECAKPIMLG